jgi:putative FmdB family regulatory protein
MPTYDYACTKCDHEFEEFHGMNEVVEKCPKCKGEVEKLIGCGGGVLFKGGGFYVTEHRSREYIADKQYDNRQKRKAERLSNR